MCRHAILKPKRSVAASSEFKRRETMVLERLLLGCRTICVHVFYSEIVCNIQQIRQTLPPIIIA